MAQDADDVVAAVRHAAERGLTIAPQLTGHGASAMAPLGDDALLLRTTGLRDVAIDVAARTARVGAGALWSDVVGPASEQGLAALHGFSPDVGVVGYTLGGGLGWYGRAHGLASSAVTAADVVLADGTRVRADADHETDLLWALKGGGGNLGVVTALEFDLVPVPELHAGTLFFPWERSAEVLHAWHAWTAQAPEAATSVGRMISLPPLPELPEELRGRSFATIEVALLGSEAEAAELLAPLRALGPEIDTFAPMPPAGLARMHMDPAAPLPYRSTHLLLGELPPAAIDAWVTAAGPDSGTSLTAVELRHLGGALARPADAALPSLPRRVPALRRRRADAARRPPRDRAGADGGPRRARGPRHRRAAPVRRGADRRRRRLLAGRLGAIGRGARAVRPGGPDACEPRRPVIQRSLGATP